MLRPLSAVLLASISLTAPAMADVWTVGHGGASQFYTVADALGDTRVKDGDILKILSGGYIGDMDFSDRALTIEPGNSPGIVDVFGNMSVGSASTINFEIGGLHAGRAQRPVEGAEIVVDDSLAGERHYAAEGAEPIGLPAFGDGPVAELGSFHHRLKAGEVADLGVPARGQVRQERLQLRVPLDGRSGVAAVAVVSGRHVGGVLEKGIVQGDRIVAVRQRPRGNGVQAPLSHVGLRVRALPAQGRYQQA